MNLCAHFVTQSLIDTLMPGNKHLALKFLADNKRFKMLAVTLNLEHIT
jgi:hypothetical protein